MTCAGLLVCVLLLTGASHGGSVFQGNDADQKLKGVSVGQALEKRTSSKAIAFRVKLLGSFTGSIGVKVPYDQVLLNEGDGFDLLHHVFKAPRSGLYMFHVEGCTTSSGGCIDLRHNHGLVATGQANQAYERMAMHVPLLLKKEDFVYVRFCKSMALYPSFNMNSFVGYFMSP